MRSFTKSYGGQDCLKDSEIYSLIEERLASGRNAELIVTGNSMAPLFTNGVTRVTLAPCGKKLSKYSIALYKRESGTVVLHRYVGKHGDLLCFRGDNESYTEKDVKASNVCGVAVNAVTNNKTVKLLGAKQLLYGLRISFIYHIKRLGRAFKRRLTRKK